MRIPELYPCENRHHGKGIDGLGSRLAISTAVLAICLMPQAAANSDADLERCALVRIDPGIAEW